MQKLKEFIVLSPIGLPINIQDGIIIKGREAFSDTEKMSDIFSSNNIFPSHPLLRKDSESCFARHTVALPHK